MIFLNECYTSEINNNISNYISWVKWVLQRKITILLSLVPYPKIQFDVILIKSIVTLFNKSPPIQITLMSRIFVDELIVQIVLMKEFKLKDVLPLPK